MSKKPLKKKIRNLVLVIALLFLSGCSIIEGSSGQGLKKYFLGFTEPHNIKMNEVSCGMERGSRAGYFLFEITPVEFTRLRQALHLKEAPQNEEFKGDDYPSMIILQALRRGSLVGGFDFASPDFDKNDYETWSKSPLASGVKIYTADPPLQPMEGNVSSSFDFLIYNPSTGKCCAFLKYPYG